MLNRGATVPKAPNSLVPQLLRTSTDGLGWSPHRSWQPRGGSGPTEDACAVSAARFQVFFAARLAGAQGRIEKAKPCLERHRADKCHRRIGRLRASHDCRVQGLRVLPPVPSHAMRGEL